MEFTTNKNSEYPLMLCASPYTGNGVVTHSVRDKNGGVTASVKPTFEGLFVYAYGIEIRFQSTDFVSTSSSATTSTTPSPGITSMPTPTSAMPTPTSAIPMSTSSSQASDGLGSGAKIGIGVGVTAGVLAIGLAVAIGYIIGQRRTRKEREAIQVGQQDYGDLPEWQDPNLTEVQSNPKGIHHELPT
jgi:hypothetical protein